MVRELRPEDLIFTARDGSKHVNHEMLESFGLFNLSKPVLRAALMVYYDNACRMNASDVNMVRVFIDLSMSIANFPKQVAVNFTRGPAYRRNMKMLKKYSR